MDKIKKTKDQSSFCLELAKRLDGEIQKVIKHPYCDGFEHHTRAENDILRLRRELNSLRKMLYPWGEDDG